MQFRLANGTVDRGHQATEDWGMALCRDTVGESSEGSQRMGPEASPLS